MAKPMPGAAPPTCASVAASVGMPTMLPWRSTSAPPLLPGLIAALVWMTSGRALPLGSLTWRPRALTIPSVTLDWRPSGLPMARTKSPTDRAEESPKVAVVRPVALIRMTAMSSGAYVPTRVPGNERPSESVTVKVVSVPTTWAFVTMSPLVSYTTPEPRPALVSISTTDGVTCLMTATNWSWSATALPDAGIVGAVVDVAAGRLAGTVVTPVGRLNALPARVEVIDDVEE